MTFVLKLLLPFFKNRRKELIKTPKVFFCDNGLRNFSLGMFNSFKERIGQGQVFENFTFSELFKLITAPHSLHY